MSIGNIGKFHLLWEMQNKVFGMLFGYIWNQMMRILHSYFEKENHLLLAFLGAGLIKF